MERSEETTRLVTWDIVIQPPALKLLKQITDKHIQKHIDNTFIELQTEPDKQSYALTDELSGY
jgi:hypothetical protein